MTLLHICHKTVVQQGRHLRLAVACGKGFGKSQAPSKPPKVRGTSRKKKAPRQQSRFIEDEEQSQTDSAVVRLPNGQERLRSPQERESARIREAQQSGDAGCDAEFERRLDRLASQRQDGLSTEGRQVEEPVDMLALEPQFGRPEPRQKVQERQSTSDASGGDSGFMTAGAGQVAGLVGAVVLIVIFLVSSLGLGGGGETQSPIDEQKLGKQQRKLVLAQAERFEADLKAAPDDVEALEGAAVSYTKLGDLPRATELLVQLSKAKPDDPQVFRLLAETQAVQGDTKAALATYEAGNSKAGGKDLDLLSGLADVLVADGRQQQAADIVSAVRKNSGDDKTVAFDQDLLLARIFARWKGHDAEALAAYDRLAEEDPTDFRVPLAKGLVLKGEGRKGDAARFFMKARYLAPAAARQAVDRLIAKQQ